MKKNKFATIIMLALLGLTSCEEGLDLLSDDPRDAFVGKWHVAESTSKKAATVYYEVNISKSSTDSTLIFINNFYGVGTNQSVEAIVSGSRTTIPSQTRDGFTFVGSGIIAYNDEKIDWIFTVDYNNGTIPYHVTATYTKL